MNVVYFRQEDRWYGLFLGSVTDLVPTAYVESLDMVAPVLLGIINYRQQPLLAIRLGPLLEPSRPGPTDNTPNRPHGRPFTSLLVVGPRGRLLGLPCEDPGCLLQVRSDHITHRASDAGGASCLQVQYLDREIIVLEVSRLIHLVDIALGRAGRNLEPDTLLGRV